MSINWYNKGIRASLSTYSFIAATGQLEPIVEGAKYTFKPITTAEMDAYLLKPEIEFAGANNLRKVCIQQYLNFYRLPEEGLNLGRCTGYPKFNSSLLPRKLVDNPDLS